jgi:hypothetical protein
LLRHDRSQKYHYKINGAGGRHIKDKGDNYEESVFVFVSVFILFFGLSCTTGNPAARNAQAAGDDSGAEFLPVDRTVLVNNLWKKTPESIGATTSYFKFFDNGYMTQIDREE